MSIYVAGDARLYAMKLAEEMARHEKDDPRGPITTAEAAEIADSEANYRFRAASDIRYRFGRALAQPHGPSFMRRTPGLPRRA